MTITEFLEARIAEDENQAAKHLPSLSSHGLGDYGLRVLAECAAKRAILESYANITKAAARRQPNVETALTIEGMGEGTRMALVALTFPYRDHPDHLKEWAL